MRIFFYFIENTNFPSIKVLHSTFSRRLYRLQNSFNVTAISSKSIREGSLYFGPFEIIKQILESEIFFQVSYNNNDLLDALEHLKLNQCIQAIIRYKRPILLWFSVTCFWCQWFGDVSKYVCFYYF